jgi:formate--tetrahydrofolate ligase
VCRKSDFAPRAAVLVATVRALKLNGGVSQAELGRENLVALADGMVNLERHVANMRRFGLPVVVALNRFPDDTEDEVALVLEQCAAPGVTAVECTVWSDGSKGGRALAEAVIEAVESGPAEVRPLYSDELPLWQKIECVAREVYGAGSVIAELKVRRKLDRLQRDGYGHLPVCIAKTQYSFTADPTVRGAPQGFELPVRDVRLAAGAEFVIAYCGNIMTMPGLPRVPAAEQIDVDEEGRIVGLF